MPDQNGHTPFQKDAEFLLHHTFVSVMLSGRVAAVERVPIDEVGESLEGDASVGYENCQLSACDGRQCGACFA